MIKVTKEMQNQCAERLACKPIGLMPGVVENVRKGICGFFDCKNIVDDFRDDLSAKEYFISGMCQSCQDETFGF